MKKIVINGQSPIDKTVKPILVIGLTPDGKIAVSGNLKDKMRLFNVIAEAIKVIANYEPSPIIKAHRMMNFVRKGRK